MENKCKCGGGGIYSVHLETCNNSPKEECNCGSNFYHTKDIHKVPSPKVSEWESDKWIEDFVYTMEKLEIPNEKIPAILNMIKRSHREIIFSIEKRVANEIINAWLIEGRCPEYHQKQKELLKQNWHTLYVAITNLIKSNYDQSN